MGKKLKWNLIVMSVLYLALGIFLLMVPGTALNVVCYALGGVVLLGAVIQLVRYFLVERGIFQSQLTLISGLVCLALGGEPVLFDTPPQGYVSGKKNVMGVRPMDIVFDAKSPIRATIQRDTFLGNQYDYQVELLGKELRVERNALDVLADPTHYEAGQEVGLKFLNVKFYEEEANA